MSSNQIKKLLTLFLLLFFLAHLYRINDGPNGFHTWRETDTALVSANFFTETLNIFSPRIDVRGGGDGVIGMEFPLYSYISGALFALFGHHHFWPRLVSTLAGILAMLFWFRGVRTLTGNEKWAFWSTIALGLSPLFFFYTRKIQPDPLAMALGLGGVHYFLESVLLGKQRLLLAAVLLATGLAIKPTFAVLGVPLLVVLWQKKGPDFLKDKTYWFFALGTLLPALLWFNRARRINESLNTDYFFLGNKWEGLWDSIFSKAFAQNFFATWFWELGIGLPLAVFFVMGVYHLRTDRHLRSVALSWFLASFVSALLTAHHISTPHDYYILPLVPLLALVTGLGLSKINWKLGTHDLFKIGRVSPIIPIILLIATPFYVFARIDQRYGEPYDFAAGREWARQQMPDQGLMVVVGDIPSYLLYRLGHKGWFIPGYDANQLKAAIRQGAKYFAIAPGHASGFTAFGPYISAPVGETDWVKVYRLKAPAEIPGP